MIAQFTRGTHYLLKGFSLIQHPHIRRFVIIPLLINIVLFGGLIWYGATEIKTLIEWLISFLPGWLAWLRWLLWPMFALIAMLIVFYLFTPVANLIGAPFNSLLAEKLEVQLTGRPLPNEKGLRSLISDTSSAFINELKKLAYLVLWAIPLLILFLIPGVNVIAPFIWFVFSAWMLALEYCDYPMGNHSLLFREERRLLRQHRQLALGFGGAVMLMSAIPVLNFLAMPVAVAGATAMWVEQLQAKS